MPISIAREQCPRSSGKRAVRTPACSDDLVCCAKQKKVVAKKASKGPAKKPVAKKPAPKRPVLRIPAASRPFVRKAPAKKAAKKAARKVPAKKNAAKKNPAKKAPAKKKAGVKKAAAKAPKLPASCFRPSTRTCNWYRTCLEKAIPCGKSGYALGFGERYCNTFNRHYNSFSAGGKKYVEGTMICLQKKLVTFLNPRTPNRTCKGIRQYAFASHSGCYTQNNFCFAVSDWPKTVAIIRDEVVNNFGPTFRQMMETGWKCSTRYLEAFRRIYKMPSLPTLNIGN
jgi:hypothetical protein